MTQRSLRPQDVLVLLKLLTYGSPRPSLVRMAVELSISASEVHGALRRLTEAGLLGSAGHVVLLAAEEFLIHGVKYAFPPQRGELARGVPTSFGAPPLNERDVASDHPAPVWPYPQGQAHGVALEPLYRSAPVAALSDPHLHELLALLDAIRSGPAPERRLAEDELRRRLHGKTDLETAARATPEHW